MSKLEKLKEERDKVNDQIKKVWFKMKLKEDDGKVPTWYFDGFKISKLYDVCPELIEEHNELSEQIGVLELLEIDKRIAKIWNTD